MELDKYGDIRTFFNSPNQSCRNERKRQICRKWGNNECADIDKAGRNEIPLVAG